VNRAPCGTLAAYQRHNRRGERPCPACRRAQRDYMRQYRGNKPDRTRDSKLELTDLALTRQEVMAAREADERMR